MGNRLSARRKLVLAVSALATFAALLPGTVGPAVAADRLVLAENFARTT
jgi:hypothetical protein